MRGQAPAAWALLTPMLVVLGVFLAAPAALALYVSLTGWTGAGSPLVAGNAPYVGPDNYAALLTREGLTRRDFLTSMANTAWYVALVVPLQSVVALALALLVDAVRGRAGALVRTLFYLPSLTSAVAVTAVFTVLFAPTGAVNTVLGGLGVCGPAWLADPDGVLHLVLHAVGVDEPAWGATDILGRTAWDWLSGPSVAMLVLVALAVWTTSGTFMLVFLAAVQDVPVELHEAARLDGAGPWHRLWHVTLPHLRPTVVLVTTLGVIGTWQVFDQVYATGGHGAPGKTLLTPAYLSYAASFGQGRFGVGAAVAFLVLGVVLAMSALQRRLLRERP